VTKKEVVKLPIESAQSQASSFIPLGIAEGAKPGPILAVIAGVHASEYAAREGAVRFWQSLEPEQLSGTVLVVLAADVTAIWAHHIYTNPVDGKNLNRIYPGKPDGTLTEVIAHTLMEQVISKADAIIDCHGGEFDEFMGLYLLTSTSGDPDLDRRTLELAFALGLPFIEVTDASGAWLGRGTLKAEAVRLGLRRAIELEAHVTGYVDAAFATPPAEVLRLISVLARSPAVVALGEMESRASLDLLRESQAHDSSRDVRHQAELAVYQIERGLGATQALEEA